MSWEMRKARFGPYYTRSRRVNGRLKRQYLGRGVRGLLAAQEDDRARSARETARQEAEALDAALAPLHEQAKQALRSALEAAGYHQHHRGEWRRRRAR